MTAINDIPEIVGAVRKGFLSGKTRSYHWRKQQLERLRTLLVDEEPKILAALRSDLGKSDYEGWVAEISMVTGEIEFTLDHLAGWMKPQRVATPLALKPGHAKIYREPLGVSCIIAPWNYPLQLTLNPLVGAIAAGNAAVMKPSEVSAAVSTLLGELVPKYLDTDCFAVIEGGVPQTTKLLEQRFDHIFYTGSGMVGKIVMRAAAEHLTPVTLELGGKSPCIVDQSANLGVAARRIVWGKYFNAGQTCVAPDYVLVHESIADELISRMANTVKSFYGEDPKESKDFARIINERHVDRLEPLIESGTVVCGGDVDREKCYIAPTILRDVEPDSKVMEDEIFGPILPVLAVSNMDAAIELVLSRPKPLALYLFASDKHVQEKVIEQASFGGGCVNDVLTHYGAPELPFGGVGASGMGACHGRTSFETFSHRKGILHKSTLIDPKLRYPPYDESKIKWTRRLL